MQGFLAFLAIVFFVVVPLAAIVVKFLPQRLEDVVFRDTDPNHAWFLVAQYAEGTFEQRFGYPSGYFALDEKRSTQPRRVLVKEAQPAGAVTDGCAINLSSMGAAGFEEGFGAGCMMLVVVMFVAAPFIVISVLDRAFRFLLRSRVDATIVQEGRDCRVRFAFFGPSGYSMRSRYELAFATPVLPPQFQVGYASPSPVGQRVPVHPSPAQPEPAAQPAPAQAQPAPVPPEPRSAPEPVAQPPPPSPAQPAREPVAPQQPVAQQAPPAPAPPPPAPAPEPVAQPSHASGSNPSIGYTPWGAPSSGETILPSD